MTWQGRGHVRLPSAGVLMDSFYTRVEGNHFSSPQLTIALSLFRPFLLRRWQACSLPPGISLFIWGFLKNHHIRDIRLLLMALPPSQGSEVQRKGTFEWGFENVCLYHWNIIKTTWNEILNRLSKKTPYFSIILTTVFISTFSAYLPAPHPPVYNVGTITVSFSFDICF